MCVAHSSRIDKPISTKLGMFLETTERYKIRKTLLGWSAGKNIFVPSQPRMIEEWRLDRNSFGKESRAKNDHTYGKPSANNN
jgi:hypothetical protein